MSLSADLAGTASDQTAAFTYNPASQIAGVSKTNDTYAWTSHYNVDRPYTANGLNQQTAAGAVALSYDAKGNLSQSGSNVYTYTAENQLQLLAGVFRLAYDPAGRLLSTSTPTVATFLGYDGADLIAEYDTARNLTRRYVHGPGDDEAFLWYEGAGLADKRYLMSDERGSITSVSDSTGAILGINRYDEYGIPAATNMGRFQYTGQTWLPEIGMYNYKARMYSPTLGRFMQTDPIGYGDGMNWYNYVGSDPVNGRDPSGFMTVVNGYRSCGFMCTSFRGEDIRRFFDFRSRGGNYGNGEPPEPREKPVVEKEPEIVVTGKRKAVYLRSINPATIYGQYASGTGEKVCLTEEQFTNIANSSKPSGPATRVSGSQRSVPVTLYSSGTKYGYSIGRATLYIDNNGIPNGFKDTGNYDSKNWGDRSYVAEATTRAAGATPGGKAFQISYPCR